MANSGSHSDQPPAPQCYYDSQRWPPTTTYVFSDWPDQDAHTECYSYEVKYQPPAGFEHDKEKGLLRFIGENGRQETFRDKPTRYLVVGVDPETGEPGPVMNDGAPKYLYLCREERETR